MSFKKKEGYGMENKELEKMVDRACQNINEKSNVKIKKTNNKKLAALILAGTIAVGGILTACGLIKSNDEEISNDIQTEDVSTDDLIEESTEEIDVNEIGMEESNPDLENEDKYENATGDVSLDEIVEDDGIIWVDEEAKENADNIGKEEIDDQNGTLEVDKDGDVVEKEEEAEIKKEDGTTVTIPVENDDRENNIPGTEVPGYEYDENIDKVVPNGDVGKAFYADADYYDAINGTKLFSKGDLISPEDLEMLKNDPNITTTKPIIEESKPEESKPEESKEESKEESNVDSYGGVVNQDGTYTIGGITFIDKATFETIISEECNETDIRHNENGVIYIKENTNTKSK